jgi:hypothetical protein
VALDSVAGAQRFHEHMDYTQDEHRLLHSFLTLAVDLQDEMLCKQHMATSSQLLAHPPSLPLTPRPPGFYKTGWLLRITSDEKFEIVPWMMSLLINLMLLLSLRKEGCVVATAARRRRC